MAVKLSRQLLSDRLKDAVSLNYLSLASIIAGVNLAVAADSLVRLFTPPAFAWDRLPLWVCAFECLYIAYSALTLAPIVATYKPNWRDHLFPLLIGLTVLLMFELSANPELVVPWYLVAGLTGLSRLGLSRYIVSRLRQIGSEDDVAAIIMQFGSSMSRLAQFHLAITVYFLAGFIALLLIPRLYTWQWVLGGVGVVALLAQIVFIEHARRELVDALG